MTYFVSMHRANRKFETWWTFQYGDEIERSVREVNALLGDLPGTNTKKLFTIAREYSLSLWKEASESVWPTVCLLWIPFHYHVNIKYIFACLVESNAVKQLYFPLWNMWVYFAILLETTDGLGSLGMARIWANPCLVRTVW